MSGDTPIRIPAEGIHLGTVAAGASGDGAYVGGVLKIRGTPAEDCYDTALEFLGAAQRCLNGNKITDGIPLLVVPGAVCATFACEMFLKYLVLRTGAKPQKWHNLLALFQDLSADTQNAITASIPSAVEVLTRNSLLFVEGRYHFEQPQFAFRHAEMLMLATALHKFCSDKFPRTA